MFAQDAILIEGKKGARRFGQVDRSHLAQCLTTHSDGRVAGTVFFAADELHHLIEPTGE